MFKFIADNQQAVLTTSRESLQLVQDALQEIEEVTNSNDYVNDKIQTWNILGVRPRCYQWRTNYPIKLIESRLKRQHLCLNSDFVHQVSWKPT